MTYFVNSSSLDFFICYECSKCFRHCSLSGIVIYCRSIESCVIYIADECV